MKQHVLRTVSLALSLLILLAAVLTGCEKEEDGEKVTVEKVSTITGADTAAYDRFAGLVVSKDTISVTNDENKAIKEVCVKVGDLVKTGTKLFSYDLDDLNLTIEQKKLEIEKSENEIEGMNEEIAELERLSAWAYGSQALEYSIRIRETKNNLREAEYNLSGKKSELEKMEASVENVDVLSPCEGRIQAISDGSSQGYDPFTGEPTGDPNAFITILELGTYRVKGTINEMNMNALMAGTPVIIRSRIDSEMTWSGTVDSIDWENPIKDNSGYYYSDEMTSSSKYPFYVALDSVDGLILGEHVYIEPDLGQQEVKTGLWLPSFYIADLETNPFVWAASGSDKLEKRSVTLGGYDEALDTYEILSGLELSDYIAFPQETLKEGAGTVKADEQTPEGFNPGGAVMPGEENGGVWVKPADGFAMEEPAINPGGVIAYGYEEEDGSHSAEDLREDSVEPLEKPAAEAE